MNQKRDKDYFWETYKDLDEAQINDLYDYYENRVFYALKRNQPGDIVLNRGMYFASVMMAEMLGQTRKDLAMVVGSFNGKISNRKNYLENLQKCVSNGVNIRILFVDEPNPRSEALQLIQRARSEGRNVKLYRASEAAIEQIRKYSKPEGNIVHFAVFDNDKYRFESVIDTFTAIGSFNDKKTAGSLLEKFDGLIQRATEIN
jgi:hypothetical protein